MVQVDLITGFLGAGKTTFLRGYVRYLTAQGHSVCILENDFGAVNIDVMLLDDLLGERCELESITGGCDCDTHQRRMRTKLISMAMRGYDRVLVEPSGIFDVDEFFDVLRDDPLDRWYRLGNVFAIVDARLEQTLSPQADYILASEAANAGRVVLSRTQEAAPGEIDATIEHLNCALAQCKCARRFGTDVFRKDWSTLTDADWSELDASGYRQSSYVKLPFDKHQAFSSQYFLRPGLPPDRLSQAARALFTATDCGHVLRVKGFVPTDGGWLELNATRDSTTVQPIYQGQEVLIVIGEGLDRAKIAAALGLPPENATAPQ